MYSANECCGMDQSFHRETAMHQNADICNDLYVLIETEAQYFH